VRYELFLSDGEPSFLHLRPADRRRYLQLPDDLPQRIGDLASGWVSGVEGDWERAKAIEKHLRSDFVYDLSSPSGEHEQPLDHFLFESRRGHCEYYSTAMAVMLRTMDIPSRNVTGFVGGTYNKFGEFYAVRQGDAHSWVEAYIEGRGWLTFDPTPPGAAEPQSDVDGMLASMRDFFEAVSQRWNQHVLGYDLRQQVSLFERMNGPGGDATSLLGRITQRRVLLAAGGVAIALLSLWWLRRRRRRTAADASPEARRRSKNEAIATGLYQGLDQVMAAMGVPRAAATPPLGHAEDLVDAGHPQAEEILALTERYLHARFGEAPLDAQERRDFELRVRRLREEARTGKSVLRRPLGGPPRGQRLPSRPAPPPIALQPIEERELVMSEPPIDDRPSQDMLDEPSGERSAGDDPHTTHDDS
jgi:hypothetical protein